MGWSLCQIGKKLGRSKSTISRELKRNPRKYLPSRAQAAYVKRRKVTKELGVKFYFPQPHQPWQRGTNENINGLLREYFPKGYDFNALSDEDLQAVVDQLNKRP